MKFFLLLLLLPCFCFSQTISSKKDEFTKAMITETSWEKIVMGWQMAGYMRIRKIDNSYYLQFKVMRNNSVFSVREDAELMLKTLKDSVITLKNIKYEITCRGCGAVGFAGSNGLGVELSFALNDEQIEFLRTNSIDKIRLYASDGYSEEKIKDKNSNVIMNEIKLFNK